MKSRIRTRVIRVGAVLGPIAFAVPSFLALGATLSGNFLATVVEHSSSVASMSSQPPAWDSITGEPESDGASCTFGAGMNTGRAYRQENYLDM